MAAWDLFDAVRIDERLERCVSRVPSFLRPHSSDSSSESVLERDPETMFDRRAGQNRRERRLDMQASLDLFVAMILAPHIRHCAGVNRD